VPGKQDPTLFDEKKFIKQLKAQIKVMKIKEPEKA